MQLKKEKKNRNFTIIKQLMDIYKWTKENVRTILDESDALLQAKFQLVYTVGNQMAPDGDSNRWSVIQKVLRMLPTNMKKLFDEHGNEKIEFDHTNTDKRRFTQSRIIDESIFDDLKDKLVENIFASRTIPVTDENKKDLKELLTKKNIGEINISETIRDFPEEDKIKFWTLSGFLRFDVLKLVLSGSKRWRASYGIDHKRDQKMAVPFKAKDTPTEMTEFGHPDVAVCFTQLSYYYSG